MDVPQLGLDTKDQARRFILFIDAAYEAKVRTFFFSLLPRRRAHSSPRSHQTKLFILSDPPITAVFSDEKPKNNGEITAHQRAVMDDLGLSADIVGASSIFTGDEEVFAFARALVSCLSCDLRRSTELYRERQALTLPRPPLLAFRSLSDHVHPLQSRLNEMSGAQWSQSSKMVQDVEH